jgi:clan AA aspartic protease (TIGR02281 family)
LPASSDGQLAAAIVDVSPQTDYTQSHHLLRPLLSIRTFEPAVYQHSFGKGDCMRHRLSILALGLNLLLGYWTFARAADKDKKTGDKPLAAKAADEKASDPATAGDPEAFLKAKGLRRVDPFFALVEETELSKKMSGLDRLKKGVIDGQRMETAAEKEEVKKKAAIVECLKRRTALRAQLQQNPPANIYNNIVSQINQLGDQAILLEKEVSENSPVKPAQAAANKAREAYVQQLLEIRQLDNRLQEKYADLAAEPKVAEMIGAYNQAHQKNLKLGPSASLASNDRKLKKFEETVLSDSIDIQRTGSQLWEVSVVFNGKDPQIIDIDTGASLVSLSYQTAKAAGLTPSENDPTIHLQMADGRVVEAKKVVASSIRVGKFEVEKVEVAVMPANLPNAGSSLGQTFLKHFTYKIDTEKSKLVMTKVDAAATAAPAAGTTKPKSSD